MKKHKKLIKRIENLIEYYQHCEDHHLEMFDRMVKQFPHLKGGLGDNITQADYNNSNHLNFHLGAGSKCKQAKKDLQLLLQFEKADSKLTIGEDSFYKKKSRLNLRQK